MIRGRKSEKADLQKKQIDEAEEQRKAKVREHEESESRNRNGENHCLAAMLVDYCLKLLQNLSAR